MPDTPRHPVTSTAEAAAYAPYSPLAICSVAVAALFLAVLLVIFVNAVRSPQPIVLDYVLVLPVVGVVLAFAARRQITDSEGTRTGLGLTATAWWVCVVGGLVYGSYLLAVGYAVQRDAESQLTNWVNNVNNADPSKPTDLAYFQAFHKTIKPQLQGRANPNRPDDLQRMRQEMKEELSVFRQSDLVRLCSRNLGANEFTVQGPQEWKQEGATMSCTLVATVKNAEGEFELVVPMTAVKEGRPVWGVVPSPRGYLNEAESKRTRYGWLVKYLEEQGREAGLSFIRASQLPGLQPMVYDSFVNTGWSPRQTEGVIRANEARVAAGGAATWMVPEPKLADDFFVSTGHGGGSGEDARRKFLFVWKTNRMTIPGTVNRNNSDSNLVPILTFTPAAAELRFPVEMLLPGGDSASNTARGRIVMTCDDPQLMAALKQLKDAAAGEKPTARPPEDIAQHRARWKVARIESDMTPLPGPAKGGPEGMSEG